MATINNSDLKKELIDGAKIQLQVDDIPGELGKTVVPVMEVNPKLLRNTNFIVTSLAQNFNNGTITTTNEFKDTYLTGVILSLWKDAFATSSNTRLTCVIDGRTTPLLIIPGETTVAQSDISSITFINPIKVDRNSAIVMTNTASVGLISVSASVFGYTVED